MAAQRHALFLYEPDHLRRGVCVGWLLSLLVLRQAIKCGRHQMVTRSGELTPSVFGRKHG